MAEQPQCVVAPERHRSSSGAPVKLPLDRRVGVLLVPERDERGLEPATHGAEPVNAGVASGAQRNQESALMNAGVTVVNSELTLRPTTLTTSAVAVEHSLAVAGEVETGVRLPCVAPSAQAGAQQTRLATRAEKPGLPTLPGRMAGR